MKLLMRFIIVSILSLLPLSVFAGPHYFRHYQVQDGLSNNIINCSLQDQRGFMWFGTRDGLNRFDGYSFRVFREEPDNPKSIGSNYITSLASDSEGTLWIGTYNGIYKYNGADESFEPVAFTQGMRASQFVFDIEDNLWLFLNGILICYNIKLDSYQTFSFPDNATATSFCFSQQGNIWIAMTNGMLYEMNRETGEFKGYDLFAHTSNYTIKLLTTVYPSLSGDKLFIGTMTQAAKVFDIQTSTYKDILQDKVREKETSVQGFLQVSADELWIASESGLFIYSISTDTYTHLQKRPYDPYSLSTNALFHFCKDNENGIWIGTYAGGINYYSPFQPFEKYYAYPGEDVMKGDLVHDICTDQYDNLWIATEDAGINKLDRKTGKYTNYQPGSGKHNITRTNIHGLVPDGDKLWVGSLNGIDLLDIPSGKVTRHYTLQENSDIVIMKKIPSGQLLTGTSRGLYRYNEKNDSFEVFAGLQTQGRVQSILEDHQGVIWVGTSRYGVYYFDPSKDESGKFAIDTINRYSDNVVNDIFEDSDHNLWFATFSGVKKFDRQTGRVSYYNTNNGMPSNTTFRILNDSMGNLWISTANGLVCLNPGTEQIKVFTQDHGLITNQFNYNSGWKDKNGRMYFGMVKGMISFVPEDIRPLANIPHTYLTNMKVFDKTTGTTIPTFSISFSEQVKLNHDQSTFSIDFSSLSYIAPEITEYAFQMEGLENNWTFLKNAHTAYYTKLPPGSYTFKVKGTNASGVWNDAPATLSIIISPPWWYSNLAILFYILLFIGVCVLIILQVIKRDRLRIERRVKQFEDKKEKELYQAKINFFINVAHEIRTPLTLIKSPLEKVINNQDLPHNAKTYLNMVDKNANRLLNLVNQLLDFRKTELDGYRLSFMKTEITELLQDITFRFRDTAEQRKLTFVINTNVNTLQAFIDKEACTKIISNLLSNAIKYASTQIIISLNYSKESDTFTIDVANDGQTIPDEIKDDIFQPFFRGVHYEHKAGTGLGLPLARSLAEMHRGSLILMPYEHGLITFRLSLPINQPDSILLPEEVENEQKEIIQSPKHELDPARPTILIVEDNEEMKEFVGKEVNSLYNILTASNGSEALILLNDYSIQLIISDIMMPVMDGFALLKKVKTDLEYSHIPVILLTAKNTTQSRLEGLELGADAYIEKPFSMDILLAQVTNLLNNRNNIRNFYFNSPIANMKSMAYTKADENFLERLNDIILAHISDIDLDVEMIAEQMNLSRPTLYRKINALSNLTPNDLIRLTRLKKAAELILQGNMKIYEISEAVGFNSQSYFSRTFSKQFGMSPSQYAQKNNVKIT